MSKPKEVVCPHCHEPVVAKGMREHIALTCTMVPLEIRKEMKGRIREDEKRPKSQTNRRNENKAKTTGKFPVWILFLFAFVVFLLFLPDDEAEEILIGLAMCGGGLLLASLIGFIGENSESNVTIFVPFK